MRYQVNTMLHSVKSATCGKYSLMADQPRLERLLRLIMMLSPGIGYSRKEIAGRLEITERTVYRYLLSLRDEGFIVVRNGDRFTIDKESPYLREIGDLLHFTREESWILNRAIMALDDEVAIKQNLASKLYALYDLKGVPYPVVRRENSEKVIRLIRAIENKECVILKGYQSSNSASVTDRMVEPFEFTLNYGYIWCYEQEAGQCKLFKTARAAEVQMTGIVWKHEELHCPEPMDVFRIHGSDQIRVKLLMNMRAANLLAEEYPMAEEFIEAAGNNQFYFRGWVTNFEGIGRFILGLPDDIRVLSPENLKLFLNEKIRGKIF